MYILRSVHCLVVLWCTSVRNIISRSSYKNILCLLVVLLHLFIQYRHKQHNTEHHLAAYTLNPYTYKQKADINVNKKVLPERFYKFVQSFQLIVFRKGVKIHSAHGSVWIFYFYFTRSLSTHIACVYIFDIYSCLSRI